MPEASGGLRGGGKAVGVAGWRQNWSAAAREGKANRSGRSRGGESQAKAVAEAGRGVGERSEAGRGDYARSATLRERANENTPRP